MIKVSQREFEYMKEHVTKCLISMLMEKEGVTLRKAFDIVYNSAIFAKLSDPETGLYFQSPGYVYSYLEAEMPLSHTIPN